MTTQANERHPAAGPPSVRRCFGAAELARLRAAGQISETLARHLVAHLGHPCAQCWRAVQSLGGFEVELGPAEIPVEPEGLGPSTDPVVLALRTLGGWPPRRWLRPSHRAALDAALGPLGFLALVLEDARRVARTAGDGVAVLAPWLQYVEALGTSGPGVAALRARALVYLAQAHLAVEDPASATAILGRAERVIDQRPAPEDLQTLLTVTRARLTEAPHPQLARAYLELAVDRIVGPKSGDLRAEVLLELAAFYLDHGDTRQAWQTMSRAGRLLGETDAPLLVARLKRYRVRWSFLMAETMRPGLQRLAAHGRALGAWADRIDIPAALDAESWRQTKALALRMGEIWAEHTPEALRRALEWIEPGHHLARFELDLRMALAGSLLSCGDAEAAEAEIDTLRRSLAASPSLASDLGRVRLVLVDLLRDFRRVASVVELLGPVVRGIDRLLYPEDEAAKVETGDLASAAPRGEGAS